MACNLSPCRGFRAWCEDFILKKNRKASGVLVTMGRLTAVLCVYNQFISYLNLREIVFCPFGIHRCILKLVLSVFSHKKNKN